ncbi:protein kinase domain protein [Cystoisospora suis]|uniref:Protein kinase domain protein n=1 Tax=Cystoisospora suis TaxID=483139 RepID=A0A2C6L4J3_9APIC|nr:protein kinase domain protein [Cystoisospora suis]
MERPGGERRKTGSAPAEQREQREQVDSSKRRGHLLRGPDRGGSFLAPSAVPKKPDKHSEEGEPGDSNKPLQSERHVNLGVVGRRGDLQIDSMEAGNNSSRPKGSSSLIPQTEKKQDDSGRGDRLELSCPLSSQPPSASMAPNRYSSPASLHHSPSSSPSSSPLSASSPLNAAASSTASVSPSSCSLSVSPSPLGTSVVTGLSPSERHLHSSQRCLPVTTQDVESGLLFSVLSNPGQGGGHSSPVLHPQPHGELGVPSQLLLLPTAESALRRGVGNGAPGLLGLRVTSSFDERAGTEQILQGRPIGHFGALRNVPPLNRVAGLDVPFDHAGTTEVEEEETGGVGELVRGIGGRDLTAVRAPGGSVEEEETSGNAGRDRGSLRVGGARDLLIRRTGGGQGGGTVLGGVTGDGKTNAVHRRRVGFASLRTFDKTNQAFQLSAEEEAALLRLAEEQQELLFADKQKSRWLQQWVEPQGSHRHVDLPGSSSLSSRQPTFWPSSSSFSSSSAITTGITSHRLKGEASVGAGEGTTGRFTRGRVERIVPTHLSSLSFSPESRRLEPSHRVVSATGLTSAPQLSALKGTSGQLGPVEVKDAGLFTVRSDGDSRSASRPIGERKEPGCSSDVEGRSRLKEEKDGVVDEHRAFDVPSFTKRERQGISAISSGESSAARGPRRVAIPKGAFKTREEVQRGEEPLCLRFVSALRSHRLGQKPEETKSTTKEDLGEKVGEPSAEPASSPKDEPSDMTSFRGKDRSVLSSAVSKDSSEPSARSRGSPVELRSEMQALDRSSSDQVEKEEQERGKISEWKEAGKVPVVRQEEDTTSEEKLLSFLCVLEQVIVQWAVSTTLYHHSLVSETDERSHSTIDTELADDRDASIVKTGSEVDDSDGKPRSSRRRALACQDWSQNTGDAHEADHPSWSEKGHSIMSSPPSTCPLSSSPSSSIHPPSPFNVTTKEEGVVSSFWRTVLPYRPPDMPLDEFIIWCQRPLGMTVEDYLRALGPSGTPEPPTLDDSSSRSPADLSVEKSCREVPQMKNVESKRRSELPRAAGESCVDRQGDLPPVQGDETTYGSKDSYVGDRGHASNEAYSSSAVWKKLYLWSQNNITALGRMLDENYVRFEEHRRQVMKRQKHLQRQFAIYNKLCFTMRRNFASLVPRQLRTIRAGMFFLISQSSMPHGRILNLSSWKAPPPSPLPVPFSLSSLSMSPGPYSRLFDEDKGAMTELSGEKRRQGKGGESRILRQRGLVAAEFFADREDLTKKIDAFRRGLQPGGEESPDLLDSKGGNFTRKGRRAGEAHYYHRAITELKRRQEEMQGVAQRQRDRLQATAEIGLFPPTPEEVPAGCKVWRCLGPTYRSTLWLLCHEASATLLVMRVSTLRPHPGIRSLFPRFMPSTRKSAPPNRFFAGSAVSFPRGNGSAGALTSSSASGRSTDEGHVGVDESKCLPKQSSSESPLGLNGTCSVEKDEHISETAAAARKQDKKDANFLNGYEDAKNMLRQTEKKTFWSYESDRESDSISVEERAVLRKALRKGLACMNPRTREEEARGRANRVCHGSAGPNAGWASTFSCRPPLRGLIGACSAYVVGNRLVEIAPHIEDISLAEHLEKHGVYKGERDLQRAKHIIFLLVHLIRSAPDPSVLLPVKSSRVFLRQRRLLLYVGLPPSTTAVLHPSSVVSVTCGPSASPAVADRDLKENAELNNECRGVSLEDKQGLRRMEVSEHRNESAILACKEIPRVSQYMGQKGNTGNDENERGGTVNKQNRSTATNTTTDEAGHSPRTCKEERRRQSFAEKNGFVLSLLDCMREPTIASVLGWNESLDRCLPPECFPSPSGKLGFTSPCTLPLYPRRAEDVSKAHSWMLGMLLYRMTCSDKRTMLRFNRREPYGCGATSSRLSSLSSLAASSPYDFDACGDEETKAFLAFCLVRDPHRRPTVSELLQHPFLNGLQRLYAARVRDSARQGSLCGFQSPSTAGEKRASPSSSVAKEGVEGLNDIPDSVASGEEGNNLIGGFDDESSSVSFLADGGSFDEQESDEDDGRDEAEEKKVHPRDTMTTKEAQSVHSSLSHRKNALNSTPKKTRQSSIDPHTDDDSRSVSISPQQPSTLPTGSSPVSTGDRLEREGRGRSRERNSEIGGREDDDDDACNEERKKVFSPRSPRVQVPSGRRRTREVTTDSDASPVASARKRRSTGSFSGVWGGRRVRVTPLARQTFSLANSTPGEEEESTPRSDFRIRTERAGETGTENRSRQRMSTSASREREEENEQGISKGTSVPVLTDYPVSTRENDNARPMSEADGASDVVRDKLSGQKLPNEGDGSYVSRQRLSYGTSHSVGREGKERIPSTDDEAFHSQKTARAIPEKRRRRSEPPGEDHSPASPYNAEKSQESSPNTVIRSRHMTRRHSAEKSRSPISSGVHSKRRKRTPVISGQARDVGRRGEEREEDGPERQQRTEEKRLGQVTEVTGRRRQSSSSSPSCRTSERQGGGGELASSSSTTVVEKKTKYRQTSRIDALLGRRPTSGHVVSGRNTSGLLACCEALFGDVGRMVPELIGRQRRGGREEDGVAFYGSNDPLLLQRKFLSDEDEGEDWQEDDGTDDEAAEGDEEDSGDDREYEEEEVSDGEGDEGEEDEQDIDGEDEGLGEEEYGKDNGE